MQETTIEIPQNHFSFKAKLVAAGVAGLLSLNACGSGSAESPESFPTPQATPETTMPTPDESFGYDVSWPQCDETLPDPIDFAIVGINGNLPSEFNPCYDEQAKWAKQSTGNTELPKFAAYVTAASPGDVASSWPDKGTNKYGDCEGDNDTACAYEYGELRARLDMQAAKKHLPKLLFIDVEPEYSWDISSELNKATLDAMGDTFQKAGIKVGVYSSDSIWSTVTGGGVNKKHSLAKAPVWALGAHTPEEADELCASPGFTEGTVLMAQVAAANGGTVLDQNYPCPK